MFVRIFFLFALLASGLAATERPNILFCMADDWGWPHAGVYGDKAISTPSFDRIAKEGALFHHTYVSSPSCTPSRNAVITGKYHWQLGPGANLWSTLPVEEESYIHLLADSGYVIGQNRAKTWGPGSIKDWKEHHGEAPAGPTFKTIADFLDQTDTKDKPFFFWLASHDPHRGYKKDTGKDSGIDLSKVHLFGHYPDNEVVRGDVADYYFAVQRWDRLVGSALEELEKRGLLDNTIIIVTGDHGMPFPRCKGNLYDSGTRVPFAVRWPKGIKGGREVEDFVSFTGVAPTLLELCGVEVPAEMTGQSFVSLLKSEKSGLLEPDKRLDIVFGRERHAPAQEKPNMGGYPSRAIRTRDFLYIHNYQPDWWPAGTGDTEKSNGPGRTYADCDGGPTKNDIIENRDKDEAHKRAFALCFGKRPEHELYDLSKDPEQLHNVADDPAYQQKLGELQQRLEQRLTELKDPRVKNPKTLEFDGHPFLGGGFGAPRVGN
ncbi:heparan N-sulfatase [Haloferula helveola]|uniref:Heparan N-sulfatase n=1 Tax=Haloferula helveola TaxID=490095 RepID=A0ABM7RIP5_9BACT|nr:heparan N-sulfatase [Haloferula helveola]